MTRESSAPVSSNRHRARARPAAYSNGRPGACHGLDRGRSRSDRSGLLDLEAVEVEVAHSSCREPDERANGLDVPEARRRPGAPRARASRFDEPGPAAVDCSPRPSICWTPLGGRKCHGRADLAGGRCEELLVVGGQLREPRERRARRPANRRRSPAAPSDGAGFAGSSGRCSSCPRGPSRRAPRDRRASSSRDTSISGRT